MNEALELSIEKWEGIIAGTETDRGGLNCPLCIEYCNEDDDDDEEHYYTCLGCVVYQKTGEDQCGNSPWEDWNRHHNEKHSTILRGMNHEIECKECERLAEAELEFLISLRED